MDGITLTRIVDQTLKERGIPRTDLCNAIGITSSAYSNWKNGGQPRKDKVQAIEKYLNIDLSKCEKSDLREGLREDLRILLNSAEDLPPSSVYALISQIEKLKEDST